MIRLIHFELLEILCDGVGDQDKDAIKADECSMTETSMKMRPPSRPASDGSFICSFLL